MTAAKPAPTTPAVAPKPRKSLFKKRIVQKADNDDKDGVDMFSRQKDTFAKVLAEQQEEKRKKLEREQQEREELRKKSLSVERKDPGSQDSKRRRISVDGEAAYGNATSDDNYSEDSPSEHSKSKNSKDYKLPSHRKSSSSAKSASPRKATGSLSRQHMQTIHLLSDSEDETKPVVEPSNSEEDNVKSFLKSSRRIPVKLDDDEPLTPIKQIVPIPDDDDLGFLDEPHPELVAEARARKERQLERQKADRLNELRRKYSSPGGPASDGGRSASGQSDLSHTAAPLSEPDPVVHINVSSYIEGTKPGIFKRRLSQRLKDVRIGWCDRQIINGQPLPEESIFLTWRNIRLSDFTTLRNLKIKVDSNGDLQIPSETNRDTYQGDILLVAFTADLFEEHKRDEERRKKQSQAPADSEEEEAPAAAEEEVEKAEKLRIILVAKGYEEFKLRVRPDTVIEKLINAFRGGRGVPEEQRMSIHFDGEELDPESDVAAAELEDMDKLEVHIN